MRNYLKRRSVARAANILALGKDLMPGFTNLKYHGKINGQHVYTTDQAISYGRTVILEATKESLMAMWA